MPIEIIKRQEAMGRPAKSPEDKMEKMVVMIAPWMAAEIDAARGDQNRSEWLRNAILSKLANHADKTPRLKALTPKPKKALEKAAEPPHRQVAIPTPKEESLASTGVKTASERAAEIKARMGMRTLSPGVANPKTGKR